MENISTEILGNLLSRLTLKSTLSKRGVLFAFSDSNNQSKREVQLYYGDQYEVNLKKDYSIGTLAKLDHVKYSLPHNFLHNFRDHMVGSCNGLVCLHTDKHTTKDSCIICNPITGEFLVLPGLRVPEFKGWHTVGYGYIPYSNEYKVVRISYDYLNQQQGHVEVYTLGSQLGWIRKGNTSYRFYSSGIFANGAIHWWGQIGRQRRYKNIIAYDLEDDKFEFVLSPPISFTQRDDIVRLLLLGENLCVIHRKGRDRILDIWAFKRNIVNNKGAKRSRMSQQGYYDHNWSWSKEFSISHDSKTYEPFAITKNNEVLLWHEHKDLYCCDSNTSIPNKLWDDVGKGYSCLQAIPHMNTPVSLEDLGECSGNDVSLDHDESSGHKVSLKGKTVRGSNSSFFNY